MNKQKTPSIRELAIRPADLVSLGSAWAGPLGKLSPLSRPEQGQEVALLNPDLFDGQGQLREEARDLLSVLAEPAAAIGLVAVGPQGVLDLVGYQTGADRSVALTHVDNQLWLQSPAPWPAILSVIETDLLDPGGRSPVLDLSLSTEEAFVFLGLLDVLRERPFDEQTGRITTAMIRDALDHSLDGLDRLAPYFRDSLFLSLPEKEGMQKACSTLIDKEWLGKIGKDLLPGEDLLDLARGLGQIRWHTILAASVLRNGQPVGLQVQLMQSEQGLGLIWYEFSGQVHLLGLDKDGILNLINGLFKDPQSFFPQEQRPQLTPRPAGPDPVRVPVPAVAPRGKRSFWATCSTLLLAATALLCLGGVAVITVAALVGSSAAGAANMPTQAAGASPTRVTGPTPGAAQPANTPAAPRATEPSASQILAGLQISEVAIVEEQPGYGYVVGLVTNRNAHPVKVVEVNVDVYDSGGATLNSGSTYALIYVLDPGQSAPFMYSYFIQSGTPAARAAAVPVQVDYSAQPAYPHSLEVTDQSTYVTSYGYVFITGMLANRGSEPVSPNPAAILRGPDGQLIAAGSGYGYMSVLKPGDETPFQIQMGPLSPALRASVEQSRYEIVLDGWRENEPVTQPVSIYSEPALYVDAYGGVHLVGSLLNGGTQPMSVYLQAALYDSNGRVLDATSLSVLPAAIAPGVQIPYDIEYWGVAGYDQLAQSSIARYEVLVDQGYSYPSDQTAFTATVEGENWEYADYRVKFTGRVINSSTGAADLTVLGVVRNGSGNPQAVALVLISNASPGSSPFECSVVMPAGFNPQTASFEVLAFGVTK